jgi:hypothetical protein
MKTAQLLRLKLMREGRLLRFSCHNRRRVLLSEAMLPVLRRHRQ